MLQVQLYLGLRDPQGVARLEVRGCDPVQPRQQQRVLRYALHWHLNIRNNVILDLTGKIIYYYAI